MFSERLKTARMEAGLSQKSLAAKLFVSQQAVGKWEVDQGSPNPETIARISEVLNISTDYLLGCTEQKEKPLTVTGEEPLDEQEKQIMELVTKLSPDQKEFLLSSMKTLLERDK